MCVHGRLRTVGNRLFCKDCGEELPLDFLTVGGKPAHEAAEAEKPVKSTGRKRKPTAAK